MNQLLQLYLRKIILFFYNILIYTSDLSYHLNQIQLGFTSLANEIFYMRFSKCLFVQEFLEYLGHIISAQGVGADQSLLKNNLGDFWA